MVDISKTFKPKNIEIVEPLIERGVKEIMEAITDDKFILAVKLYKSYGGCGLMEAKEGFEQYITKERNPYNTITKVNLVVDKDFTEEYMKLDLLEKRLK
jgi:hypothetical protein